jgi:hypothetical protein
MRKLRCGAIFGASNDLDNFHAVDRLTGFFQRLLPSCISAQEQSFKELPLTNSICETVVRCI